MLFLWVILAKVRSRDIERVDEIGVVSIGSLSAFNFKNRFMSRAFMIKFKHGWFARQVLITPEDAEQWAGCESTASR
ncbi:MULTISPECIES: hypothetical protein [unclassified Lysobacter]|uniref:hypothetical protein n=1 Tax=unclassified Lysobacter TaxID=2635362 RepID=UPI001BE603A6|nr:MULTISPECIES: hypothetical protein [unclassified Lysobacter]MBT2745864.1 hypothetical protein [Lysobacter sp. ISL-42]MBT2749577.1 hypothetical protein [Lysobacter sp. ISL-50]MBT2778779.1 hypothetical protein [Lysobacter sp. ISL-54]MBT2781374.1 hypothetical protein [Lysobacter sp. ISL-52]